MLSGFDWLRRCRTGAELLATLHYLERKPDLFDHEEIGSPHSALSGPCQRCWIYPRYASPGRKPSRYCTSCRAILAHAYWLGHISRQAIVVWALVNRLPKQLESGAGFSDSRILGVYAHGQNHFLVAMQRQELKPWLQELAIYHGTALKGLIQILPTTGTGRGISMADVLCRAAHHEARFAMDQLRVRFFSAPHQLLAPHTRDRQGMLTFEVSDFLSLLEMAAVFRTLLRPEAQEALYELLNLDDASEEQFYWGRFLGYLSPEAKDMLSAWRIRQWSKDRIQLLYELVGYVAFYQPG
ncbi:MAG: hypothetical protein H8D78_20780 [Chloroflexi bacterium]|nr:hypothetical protein [Chloroflexota bacterium]